MIRRTEIDDEPCLVAPHPDGWTKVVFDDGRVVILKPVPPAQKVQTPEFYRGDLPGHPFRGNQWTDGEGTSTLPADFGEEATAEPGGGDTHRALSTNTWGDFKEFASHPLLQSVLLNVKAAQEKYEREGGIPGVRVDNDPLIRQERVEPDAARAAIRFNHMEDSRIAEFVIDNGTDFPVPKTAPPILLRRPKECYRNAGQFVLEQPEKYDYAEGYVVMPGHLNEPVHHGWAIDRKTGTVVDPTLGWVPSARYVGVRLEAWQLAAHVARGGLWGVTMQSGEPTDLVLKNKGYVGAPEPKKKPRKPTAKAPAKRKKGTPRAEA